MPSRKPLVRLCLALAMLVPVGVRVTYAAAGGEGAPVLPDVIEEVPQHLQIQNTQQGEWLRFTTTHINIGAGNLQIRGGGQVAPCDIDGIHYEQCPVATQELLDAAGTVVMTHPAGVAFFHPEHNHWHQSGVAAFAIKKDDPYTRTEVATGVKITFCFVDVVFTGVTGNEKKPTPRRYFECNGDFQGLAVGWGDSYHQSTPLQELEVTGLPVGDYYLTHLADPDNHWLEGPSATSPGEQDNFTWLKFHLSRTGANPEVTVVDHSPCSGPTCPGGANP